MFTELAYSIVDALIVLLLHTMPISNDYYIMIKEKEEEIGSQIHSSFLLPHFHLRPLQSIRSHFPHGFCICGDCPIEAPERSLVSEQECSFSTERESVNAASVAGSRQELSDQILDAWKIG
jgi:hypothetical protein